MPNNAFQGTFTPSLPKSALTEAELALMRKVGAFDVPLVLTGTLPEEEPDA